ncbi:alpha/beta fold hydrolase [Streptomyces boncukensis]|uniref:Alpha/beta hydrolase n=1 Tax=Streptomyces boncukensis TaxID=2711219 RepID=A0A6G4WWS0_9ACTN|nr:alpha/beta hydrolase [Streptomyces boncukensis]NGO68974.1 alpha/beta hydrolase [Streptomyces boncukensis]
MAYDQAVLTDDQAVLTGDQYALDVRTYGDSGPALLLAHGAGGGIDGNFGLVTHALARDHAVVGPHYPGAGATPRATAPLVLDTLVDSLVAAAVERGHERFAVLGESLGSAVAVRAATRHPERVTALVLTAGFAVADPVLDGAARLLATLGAAGERDAMARLATLGCLSEEQFRTLSPGDLEAAVAGARESMPPGFLDHFDLVRRVDVRGDLARVRVPSLVAVPTGDRLVLPDSGRRLAAGIDGAAVLEIPGGAHILSAPDRAVWLERVREFLAHAGS